MESGDITGVRVTAETDVFAVIGSPISHSVSPQLHNTISSVTGNKFLYCAFHVYPEELGEAIRGMRALGIKGLNVTVPHKEQVLQYLDWVSPEARVIGAVNTVVNCNGKLMGFNTDVTGLGTAISEMGFDFSGKQILILGAGGTSKAAGYACWKAGASKVVFCNRTEEKAKEIVERFRHLEGDFSSISGAREDFPEIFRSFDLVINTTAVGMPPQEALMPIREDVTFRSGQFVYDVIFKPARTLFLAKAEREGCVMQNGMSMLFFQGIKAHDIWLTAKKAGWDPEKFIKAPGSGLSRDEIFVVKNILQSKGVLVW